MRLLLFTLSFAALSVPAFAQRQSLGIFGQWGAFRDGDGSRCFAIAEPPQARRNLQWKPFASVAFYQKRGTRGQIHFRLSRTKRAGSALILRIDDRTFQLVGGGANAWASGPEADAAIVSAMRSGLTMTLETRSERGGLIRDSYQLRGAATAVDAAAIACAPRR
jgi:hypothetical protein